MPPARAEILESLDGLLKKGGVTSFVFGYADPTPPRGAIQLPCPRFTILLSGRRELHYGTGREEAIRTMGPGDAFFALPGGWNSSRYPATFGSLGMSFPPDYLRCILLRHGQRYERGSGPDAWLHTARPLPEPGREILAAVLSLGRTEPDVRAGCDLLNAFLRVVRGEIRRHPTAERSQEQHTWEHVSEYVREHCHLTIDRSDVARALRLHPNSISRLFQRYADVPFHRWLTRIRLERAELLLADPALSVNEVAARCGFSDAGHFIRVFRRNRGISPGRWRRGET